VAFARRATNGGLAVVISGLLLTACGRPDSQLQRKLVGTWMQGDSFEMTLAPDGNLHSKFTSNTNDKEFDFVGTWIASNHFLIVTVTGENGRNWASTNTEPVGSIEHFKIIKVDATHLTAGVNGYTNTYVRKR
jgi:hypothetical protein